jgi:hypothetical protein
MVTLMRALVNALLLLLAQATDGRCPLRPIPQAPYLNDFAPMAPAEGVELVQRAVREDNVQH